jgi:hypothetical protein
MNASPDPLSRVSCSDQFISFHEPRFPFDIRKWRPLSHPIEDLAKHLIVMLAGREYRMPTPGLEHKSCPTPFGH